MHAARHGPLFHGRGAVHYSNGRVVPHHGNGSCPSRGEPLVKVDVAGVCGALVSGPLGVIRPEGAVAAQYPDCAHQQTLLGGWLVSRSVLLSHLTFSRTTSRALPTRLLCSRPGKQHGKYRLFSPSTTDGSARGHAEHPCL